METKTKRFDTKAVSSGDAYLYRAFGWVRSKEPVPSDLQGKKAKKGESLVLLKRKFGFSASSELKDCENEFEKLKKKKYRQQPIIGIIAFFLMIALLLVAGIELYYGIDKGVKLLKENKPAEAELSDETEEGTDESEAPQNAEKDATEETATENAKDEEEGDGEETAKQGGILDSVKTVLDKVHDEYLSKATDIFAGKTDEEGNYNSGIADKVAEALPEEIAYFVSADTLVGVIALVLAIIFIIIFSAVCKIKSKRVKRDNKLEDLLAEAEDITSRMRKRDPSLMGKIERKQYMWTSIIADGIRMANGSEQDDDD